MAALVQTISQPITTVSMLQTRPASSSATFSHQRGGSSPRSGNIIQYRPSASVPQPLNQISGNNQNPLRQHPPASSRFENRSMSAPGDISSVVLSSSPNASENADSHLKTDPNRLSLLSTSLDLTLTDPRLNKDSKPSTDKNNTHKRTETSSARLPTQSLATSSASGSSNLYNMPSQSLSSPSNIGLSKDDTAISQLSEIAQRYRRRSIVTQDNADSLTNGPNSSTVKPAQSGPARTWASIVSTPYTPPKPNTPNTQTKLRPSSTNDGQGSNNVTSDTSLTSDESSSQQSTTLQNEVKIINIPPRGSSDATKRLNNPSPLSNPVSSDMQQPVTQSSFAKLVSEKATETQTQSSPKPAIESPAQQHLASLSKKDGKKDGKQSRLRRAFSFGSAAELRKASAENSHAATTRKLQKPQYETEEEAKEAAIVRQQEASGLGNSIYSGQGNVFSGSTDNLSVSSTASSASIMLRKMGKGVKKGTRSLVGLFRPKSVIGVPAADSAVPELSTAQVSMVTVEAEREKVNVNLHPSDQAGGETGFPKLERNSMDFGESELSLEISDRSVDGIKPRRSIVGSEKDRAEVLAAVKKGILKRSDTDSGSSSPAIRSPDQTLSQLPQFSRSNTAPQATTPNTADDNASRGHRRTDSVTIEGEDYFITMGRFTGSDSKSLPGTPRSVRNISFSPRIQFHDTWTANDYDRRSEIATCNRLTPSLAQAIKEELNTFKMEMEVHESSKVYTHFF